MVYAMEEKVVYRVSIPALRIYRKFPTFWKAVHFMREYRKGYDVFILFPNGWKILFYEKQ